MISVIVPIYKVENYLDKCIRSILAQSYKEFELLLVDDGSPDKCGEMCDTWASRDNRIRVIHKDNGGLSDARNAGIQQASGEYICFVDSDDWIAEDMLETLHELAIHSGADMSCCNFIKVNEQGNQVEELAKITSGVYTQDEYWDMRFKANVKIYFDVAWNKLYRRELFSSVKYPFGKIHEDVLVIHKIVCQCHKIAITEYVGYYYLIRDNSIMRSKRSLRNLAAPEAYLDWASAFIKKKKWYFAEESLNSAVLVLLNNEYGDNGKKSNDYKIIKRKVLGLYRSLFFRLSLKRKLSILLFCVNENLARALRGSLTGKQSGE